MVEKSSKLDHKQTGLYDLTFCWPSKYHTCMRNDDNFKIYSVMLRELRVRCDYQYQTQEWYTLYIVSLSA